MLQYAGHKVSEVPPQDMRYLITDFISDADFIMAGTVDKDYLSKLIGWTFHFVTEKFPFFPINHLSKAIEAGSMGQRGGTSKLIPRNIAIWINEQKVVYEAQCMELQKKQDFERMENNLNYKKSDGFVGAAVRIKVGWLGDKFITSKEYDSFSSSEIYRLLKAGVKECDIRPSHILNPLNPK